MNTTATDAFRRVLLLLALLSCALLARAAVPNEDAVPAYAEEQTVLQTERNTPEPGWLDAASGRQHFDRHYLEPFGHLPEQDVVLQRGGNTWRVLHNGVLAGWVGTLIVLMALALLAAWRFVGPARTPPPTGRNIRRFSPWQRGIHWATAISFILLALSGLLILFGKKLVLPWLGHDAFAALAMASKLLHNVVGPLFLACSVLLFATFLRHNVFRRIDWRWLRKAGGLIGHEHVPAGYFNAGEKLWFWFGVTLLGLVMSISGLVLDFPYWSGGGSTRYVQQWADALHLAAAALYIVAAMGHTYLGTAGTPGTYRGMRHGDVDEAWAQQHHPLWAEEVRAQRNGRVAS